MTGEGGSGGALALAVADRVLMLENALYSVISPRGCASILWKDPTREAEAADTLQITAQDLHSFGMIEGIIQEGSSNAQLMRNVARGRCATSSQSCRGAKHLSDARENGMKNSVKSEFSEQ